MLWRVTAIRHASLEVLTRNDRLKAIQEASEVCSCVQRGGLTVLRLSRLELHTEPAVCASQLAAGEIVKELWHFVAVEQSARVFDALSLWVKVVNGQQLSLKAKFACEVVGDRLFVLLLRSFSIL